MSSFLKFSRAPLNLFYSSCSTKAFYTTKQNLPSAAECREILRPLGEGLIQVSGMETNVATITIHNPTSKNAFTGKMMAELADAVDELEKWVGVCVLLTGAKDSFCSGADLRLVRSGSLKSQSAAGIMSAVMQDTLKRLHQCDVISVAAIEGRAVGGGAELTTCCDYRVISDSAMVQFVHAKMGVVPGWGGAGRLINLVGRRRALHLLAASQPCDAKSCLEFGLVDHIAKSGKALDEARQFVQPFFGKFC